MGNLIKKPLTEHSSKELLLICENNKSPTIVIETIRNNNINGATLNELDEETIESLGKTLLEKKQLLGEYHRCMPGTITLPPLIKSPYRQKTHRVTNSPINKNINSSLRNKISPIKSPSQFNENNNVRSNIMVSPSGSSSNSSSSSKKRLQTVKIEKYDDGEISNIISSMSEYPDTDDVQQYGCKQFGELAAENPETCRYIGKVGGIQVILNAMTNCPNAKRVQIDATFAIANIIKDEENRLLAIEQGAIEMIRKALEIFDGDADLIELAYPCLTLLGEDVEEEEKQLEDKFGISGLLDTMRANENDASVQERACWAISTLAQDRSIEIHQQLTSKKATNLVSNAIIKFGKENVDLINYAFQACHHLSKIRQNRIFIVRSGLLDSVLIGMKWHSTNSDVQSIGSLIIERFGNKENFQTILCEKGAIEILLNTIKIHQENLEVIKNAFRAISNVILNHKENKKIACTIDFIETVGQIMKRFDEEIVVQTHGCLIYGLLADNWYFTKDFIKQLPTVLEAMKLYLNKVSLQQGGCMLLYYIYENVMEKKDLAKVKQQHENNTKQNKNVSTTNLPETKVADKSSGTTSAVTATTTTTTTTTAFIGADAINTIKSASLSSIIDVDTKITNTAVFQILTLMDFHRKDPRLVEWASRAIAVIAGENVDARKQFTDMNGTAILLMSMSLFPTNENIQHCICYALSRTVSNHPFNRAKVRQQGGIHRIIDAMRRFESNQSIQQNGCAVIGNLAAGPTPLNQEALSEQGASAAILRAMQNHLDVALVQQSACQALYFLAWNQPGICKDVEEGGGLDLIERSKMAHPYHSGVQYWAKNSKFVVETCQNIPNQQGEEDYDAEK